MSNILPSLIRNRIIDILEVYDRAEATISFEADCRRAAEEIGEQVARRYMDIVKMGPRQKFVDEAKAEIEMVVMDASKLAHDPWIVCRDASRRVKFAYDALRIIEGKAGARHKFTVWSGHLYGGRGLGRKGVKFLVAASSKKAAVEMMNDRFGTRETVSWANDHWSMGGTVGDQVATKIGIWIGDDKFCSEKDYKLAWEPKS